MSEQYKMTAKDLTTIKIATGESNRSCAKNIGVAPQTFGRWRNNEVNIPRIGQKIIEHSWGDGTPGSAIKWALTKIQEKWSNFIEDLSTTEAIQLTTGAVDVVIMGDTFELSSVRQREYLKQEYQEYAGALMYEAYSLYELPHPQADVSTSDEPVRDELMKICCAVSDDPENPIDPEDLSHMKDIAGQSILFLAAIAAKDFLQKLDIEEDFKKAIETYLIDLETERELANQEHLDEII